MTLFQAIVLGIIQGLSEFLPISSSAHLALTPWLLHWPEPGLSFDVALHTGTLVAVLGYFRDEWIRLARAAWEIVTTRTVATESQRRVVLLVIATIPGGIAGLALDKYAETTFRAPALIAWAMIILGVLLWLADRGAREVRTLHDMNWRDALLIGIAQIFALIPGVSRSGSTITAGLADRFDRESAAVFSFLMSMPIIAAAAILKVPHVLHEQGLSAPLVAGVLASAISGWLAIAALLRYVTRRSYGIFALYRVLAGVAVLLIVHYRG
ncbi:MAG TPA: undecaprenyl-diphosphate phosphatase [Gemmatimonadaceae bacterium]|nr:undecaprenyl-diphosphate phosphatase [Gemmatimonadaceae bacterium]